MKNTLFFGSLLSAFAIGSGAMWAWQQHQEAAVSDVAAAMVAPAAVVTAAQSSQPLANSMTNSMATINDRMAAMQDMRQHMAQMQQRMQALFGQDDFFNQAGMAAGPYGGGISALNGSGMDAAIQEGEDDHSVFYKLVVGNQDVSNMNVTVENGYVSIKADLSEKSSNSYAQSTVAETFPVPAGVDPDSAKVDREQDAIVIRFDKVS